MIDTRLVTARHAVKHQQMENTDFDIEQLIGRRASDDISADALKALEGKRVAVTGAAGSIGSEICRQLVAHCNLSEMLLIDNGETPIHELRLELGKNVPQKHPFCHCRHTRQKKD